MSSDYFKYKREIAFDIFVSEIGCIQGIPGIQGDIDKIREELQAESLESNKNNIKLILNRLNLVKYYDYWRYIYSQLNNLEYVTIPDDLKKELSARFHEINKVVYGCRRDLQLPHHVVAKYMLKLLNADAKYVNMVSITDSKTKQEMYMYAWNQICDILKWK